jgi:xylan 1,4-beta-xylosidase
MNRSRITIFGLIFGLPLLVAAVFFLGRTSPGKTYTNPVLVETFESPVMGRVGIGDPDVISFEGKFYLYPTGDNRGYDVYTSRDLVHWKKGPRVFQARESGVWAPDVLYNPADRRFYLYYTANRHVGVAVSDRPDGKFRDLGILSDHAIDADMFLDDDGRYYLYYATYPDFSIRVQPMESPVRKKGRSLVLFRPDTPWEKKGGAITEAPWVLKHRGIYYLLYSGGGANTEDYAIGYATADSPLGPFMKYKGNPIVKKGRGVYGPGHCSVIETPRGELWMIYHQKRDDRRNWDRIICIDPLRFDEAGVLHGRATRGAALPAPRIQ